MSLDRLQTLKDSIDVVHSVEIMIVVQEGPEQVLGSTDFMNIPSLLATVHREWDDVLCRLKLYVVFQETPAVLVVGRSSHNLIGSIGSIGIVNDLVFDLSIFSFAIDLMTRLDLRRFR
jgi:hypothetical protein